MRRTPSPRPFRLSDAVVLIVATAVGLALIRAVDQYVGGLFERFQRDELFAGSWRDRLSAWMLAFYAGLIPLLLMAAPWAIALLALRLRRPRPRLRRVWRQPGTMACLAFLMILGLKFVMLAGQAAVGRGMGIPWKDIDFNLNLPGDGGLIVLGMWLAARLARTSRPEKSWIDRAGRALGILMIAAVLIGYLVPAWNGAMMPKWRPPPTPTFQEIIDSVEDEAPTKPKPRTREDLILPPMKWPEGLQGDPVPTATPPLPANPPAPKENPEAREKTEPPRRHPGRGDE